LNKTQLVSEKTQIFEEETVFAGRPFGEKNVLGHPKKSV
jgi:hypothetical protein